MKKTYLLFTMQLVLLTSCNVNTAIADIDSQILTFNSKQLELGREIWIENCKGCHAYGTAGAPVPMIKEDWKPRVTKDISVLYAHAINGFFGPDDTMMPERGGNPNLSDKEVKLAVDYMLKLAIFYIEKLDN